MMICWILYIANMNKYQELSMDYNENMLSSIYCCVEKYWKQRFIKMLTLLSLVALVVVIMTTLLSPVTTKLASWKQVILSVGFDQCQMDVTIESTKLQ